METFKHFAEQTKSKYVIKKSESSNSRGVTKVVYNVVDASDGYVYDTFSLKRDAKHWIDQAEKSKS
jgi:hypothetical protein